MRIVILRTVSLGNQDGPYTGSPGLPLSYRPMVCPRFPSVVNCQQESVVLGARPEMTLAGGNADSGRAAIIVRCGGVRLSSQSFSEARFTISSKNINSR